MKNNKENPEILQITQIKIVLPDKTLELNSEEARKVYEELGKLFDKEKTDLQKFKEEYDKIVPQKEYIPYYPIYIERWLYTPPWKYWEFTCQTTTSYLNSVGNFNKQILSINLT